MLTVRREGERGKDNTDGRSCKSYALGQEGEYRGKPECNIEIRENAQTVDAEVDKTQGHSELVREVQAVAGARRELSVILEALAVKEESESQGHKEQGGEEHVHKQIVRVAECLVSRTGCKSCIVRRDAKVFV